MKITIETFERRIVKEDVKIIEVELPTTQCHFFQTHIRRSIQITPIWTTWNKEMYQKEEEIYSYDIICVYLSFECKVEKTNEVISTFRDNYNSDEKSILKKYVLGHLDKRDKYMFDSDLNTALESFKNSEL